MIAARPALPPVFAAVILAASACSSGDAASGTALQASPGGLPPGVVARVGTVDIHAASVGRIAAAQNIDPARALDLAVRDALFAGEASARRLDAAPAARAALRGALARLLLRDIHEASVRAGPVTDDELREATARRFLELDRPAGARTVHAVVRLGKKDDSARRKRASEIAEAIRAALAPVRAAEEALRVADQPRTQAATSVQTPDGEEDPLIERFRSAATAVPREGFEVVVEALPPVAADGRILAPGGQTFALEFASAAAALEARADISPVVVSPFGAHVIMLLERTPAKTAPLEERRRLVLRDVAMARARAAEESLLGRMRQEVAIDPNADAMLAQVSIDAHDVRPGETSRAPDVPVIER